jgi:hypothetical protein
MTKDQLLLNLYKNSFPKLIEEINLYNNHIQETNKNLRNRATNPLMLKCPSGWEEADQRIMIFGQETNYWANECGNKAVFSGKIERTIKVYDDFYLSNKMYNSPFWNEFRRIKKESGKVRKVSVAWNNIVKIGKLGTGNVPAINKITKNHFNVIAKEIEILKPDVLVFFTGPVYDSFIEDYLGKFDKKPIEGFETKQLCEIEFKTDHGIRKALRTYHPFYLYRNKIRKEFIEAVIKNLNLQPIKQIPPPHFSSKDHLSNKRSGF